MNWSETMNSDDDSQFATKITTLENNLSLDRQNPDRRIERYTVSVEFEFEGTLYSVPLDVHVDRSGEVTGCTIGKSGTSVHGSDLDKLLSDYRYDLARSHGKPGWLARLERAAEIAVDKAKRSDKIPVASDGGID